MKSPFSNSSNPPINVLLVGNNPIELGKVLENLKLVRNRKIITEISFDIKSTIERLINFNPNFILIDDNLGKEELIQTVNTLASTKKTRNVPITILKNSNYNESLPSAGILDYLLKQALSPETLYNSIKNTLRLKRTQKLLQKIYKEKRGIFKQLAAVSNLI